ncbi:MAG: transposase family protein [Nitrospirae bacterium]|nr:transposase family protein [Nitrospirota bacterium]
MLLHIEQSLAGVPAGRELSSRIRELARHYGVSVKTIQRGASQRGLRWRKERADKGQSLLSEEEIQMAATLQLMSRRLSNQIILPVVDAQEILEDSGLLSVKVSPSTLCRKLREARISARDLTAPSPHVNLISEHPNQMWQFDVTNCVQYFLDDGGLEERDLELDLSKNKIKNLKEVKRHLLRYVAVDHCSGAFYVRYFYASGETKTDGAQFLFEAFSKKQDEQYRLHGVPKILYADHGSITRARALQDLLKALQVDLQMHMPGNPRAKGAVEGMMKFLLRLEARLKMRRPRNLAEYNAWVYDWCVKVNAVNKFRKVAPRSALWSWITSEQLRLCPPEAVYRKLFREPKLMRTVQGNLMISLDGQEYRVPDSSLVKQEVEVYRSAYKYQEQEVEVHGNGQVWVLLPIEKDAFGQRTTGVPVGTHKALKETPTQKAKKKMEKISEQWGITWKGTGDKRRAEAPPVGHESPLVVFGHQREKVAGLAFLDRQGTPIEVKVAPARLVPLVEAMVRIREEIGRSVTLEENRRLREEFGCGIPEEEISRLAECLSRPGGTITRQTGVRIAGERE